MPRAGLSAQRVVDEAATLVDEVGWNELTLAALAKRLGVQLPSLYKHVAGLSDVRRCVVLHAKTELTAVMTRAVAGKSRGVCLRALSDAFLGWARGHPGLYQASTIAPVAGDLEDERVSKDAVDVVFAVLSGYELGETEMIDATRSLRAALHGYVSLQHGGGFQMDRSVDDSFAWFIAAIDSALSAAQDAVRARC